MDKEYVLYTIKQRIAELQKRYAKLCVGKDEDGNILSTTGYAQSCRTACKKELNLCLLVEALVMGTKTELLSEEAIEGLDRLIEPNDRHKRLGGYKRRAVVETNALGSGSVGKV